VRIDRSSQIGAASRAGWRRVPVLSSRGHKAIRLTASRGVLALRAGAQISELHSCTSTRGEGSLPAARSQLRRREKRTHGDRRNKAETKTSDTVDVRTRRRAMKETLPVPNSPGLIDASVVGPPRAYGASCRRVRVAFSPAPRQRSRGQAGRMAGYRSQPPPFFLFLLWSSSTNQNAAGHEGPSPPSIASPYMEIHTDGRWRKAGTTRSFRCFAQAGLGVRCPAASMRMRAVRVARRTGGHPAMIQDP